MAFDSPDSPDGCRKDSGRSHDASTPTSSPSPTTAAAAAAAAAVDALCGTSLRASSPGCLTGSQSPSFLAASGSAGSSGRSAVSFSASAVPTPTSSFEPYGAFLTSNRAPGQASTPASSFSLSSSPTSSSSSAALISSSSSSSSSSADASCSSSGQFSNSTSPASSPEEIAAFFAAGDAVTTSSLRSSISKLDSSCSASASGAGWSDSTQDASMPSSSASLMRGHSVELSSSISDGIPRFMRTHSIEVSSSAYAFSCSNNSNSGLRQTSSSYLGGSTSESDLGSSLGMSVQMDRMDEGQDPRAYSRAVPPEVVPISLEQTSEEFAQIRKMTEKRLSPRKYARLYTAGCLNGSLNRYRDVLPYETTRVRLHPMPGCTDYINASFVRTNAGYVSAQAPLSHTVNDFWRMAWEQNVPVILMLTRLREKGMVKANTYWPREVHTALHCGPVVVTLLAQERLNEHIVLRKLSIRNTRCCYGLSGERVVIHLHYTEWPDFGLPASPVGMQYLVSVTDALVAEASSVGQTGPVLVHCSAGIGRAGTFIAVRTALHSIRARAQLPDIAQLVLNLRAQRRGMVQTPEQYAFIYTVALDLLSRLRKARLLCHTTNSGDPVSSSGVHSSNSAASSSSASSASPPSSSSLASCRSPSTSPSARNPMLLVSSPPSSSNLGGPESQATTTSAGSRAQQCSATAPDPLEPVSCPNAHAGQVVCYHPLNMDDFEPVSVVLKIASGYRISAFHKSPLRYCRCAKADDEDDEDDMDTSEDEPSTLCRHCGGSRSHPHSLTTSDESPTPPTLSPCTSWALSTSSDSVMISESWQSGGWSVQSSSANMNTNNSTYPSS